MKIKKIFISGGGGYVGSSLVSLLLKNNYFVTVYDIFNFGNNLKKNKSLSIIKGDIRDIKKLKESINDHDCVINLAHVQGDERFMINKKISTEINRDSFKPFVEISKKLGIKKFINTSSSSVYGISNKKNDEKNKPYPVSLYSKINLINENELHKFSSSSFVTTNVRPGSIYGISSKMKLADSIINHFTFSALTKKRIDLYGGLQLRSFVSIDDLLLIYLKLIQSKDKLINKETFNVGYKNHSLEYISILIKTLVEEKIKKRIKINYYGTNDVRSYTVNSDKVRKILNIEFKTTIEKTVNELIRKYEKIPNKEKIYKKKYINKGLYLFKSFY